MKHFLYRKSNKPGKVAVTITQGNGEQRTIEVSERAAMKVARAQERANG